MDTFQEIVKVAHLLCNYPDFWFVIGFGLGSYGLFCDCRHGVRGECGPEEKKAG